jgi:hypothetical protein
LLINLSTDATESSTIYKTINDNVDKTYYGLKLTFSNNIHEYEIFINNTDPSCAKYGIHGDLSGAQIRLFKESNPDDFDNILSDLFYQKQVYKSDNCIVNKNNDNFTFVF